MNSMTPTPTDTPPPLDPAHRSLALRGQVRAIMDAENLSQKDAATQSGIAYGTFTAWFAGTYAGSVAKYDDLVEKWLVSRTAAARKRAELPSGPGFVKTPASQNFFAALETAQHTPDLALITGSAGVGKTTAIEAYRARSSNVWVVVGEPCLATPRMLLEEIAELLGISEWRSSHRISRAIVAKMRGTRGLLVVDEAQHLSTTTLEQLRTLHDMAGVGLALVGNERVASRIEGGTRKPEFAQLFSRVGMRITRPRATKADLDALLDGWQVTDMEVRKLLLAIARKPGALRSTMKTLRQAMMQAAAVEEPLAARHVQLAYQALSAQAIEVEA